MASQHPRQVPFLLFADQQGNITEYDGLLMAGASGENFSLPETEDLIPLPEGSELFALPGRVPVGIEKDSGEASLLTDHPYESGKPLQAVAAFLAPAHTAIYTSGYQTLPNAPMLPLFAYTAVGWLDGRFYVTAFRSDPSKRQDPEQFKQETINKKTKKILKQHPGNRLIQHLGKCCLTYGCPAARNFFLGRWEAPLPSSPTCNAACIGCISLQPSGCCSATQDRIKFVPTPQEIAEIAVKHIKNAPEPVVSFGQGCEGEPLLQTETLIKAIRIIRQQTTKGTINLNTNASKPRAVARMAESGLDSIRISLNSGQKKYHSNYYQPKDFSLEEVRQSGRIMKEHNKHVSLNYFILPGFTDDPAEFTALCRLIEQDKPDLIQLRNLNIDPEYYLQQINFKPTGKPMGIRNWLEQIKKEFPHLSFGYFNPFLG